MHKAKLEDDHACAHALLYKRPTDRTPLQAGGQGFRQLSAQGPEVGPKHLLRKFPTKTKNTSQEVQYNYLAIFFSATVHFP